MIGIVIVTHSQLGQALIEAAEFVLNSPVENCVSVSVNLNEPVTKLRKDIARCIKDVDNGEGVLILTDMFGGTPSNLSYSFLEEGKVEVLSGVNLPILVRASTMRKNRDLAALSKQVENDGKKSIRLASDILKGNKAG